MIKFEDYYKNLEKNFSQDELINFSYAFQNNFPHVDIGDKMYSRYFLTLFTDFFNQEQFEFFSKNFLKETDHPNLYFSCLLFKLSLELNSDKTLKEKEILFNLSFNLIAKHNNAINNNCHYSVGYVSAQAANIGVDISSSLCLMPKILKEHSPFFEEGFIDGVSSSDEHLLQNPKLFSLFVSKYNHWATNSQELLIDSYVHFIQQSHQVKIFNPINSQSFFWMNHFFTNPELKEYISSFCEQSFKKQTEFLKPQQEIENKYFDSQKNLKQYKSDNQKLINFFNIIKNYLPELSEVSIDNPQSEIILKSFFENQQNYISQLEKYKSDTERTKAIKEGIKKAL